MSTENENLPKTGWPDPVGFDVIAMNLHGISKDTAIDTAARAIAEHLTNFIATRSKKDQRRSVFLVVRAGCGQDLLQAVFADKMVSLCMFKTKIGKEKP